MHQELSNLVPFRAEVDNTVPPAVIEMVAYECAIFLQAHTQGKGKKKLDSDMLLAALLQVCIIPLSANMLVQLNLHATVLTLAEIYQGTPVGEAARVIVNEWEQVHSVAALATPSNSSA